MPRIAHNNNNNGNVPSSKDEGDNKMKEGMKKGPWTPAEDEILREYVMKYGEGNWNWVQKNTGLARCGKSCRLRWVNHLKPNLKKGAFSKEEEQIIIQLHAKLGNKWAQMAAQLPGRTDNEIKNFWNTRMKKRQRAGLPLYPPQVQQHESNTYNLQQKQHFTQPRSSSSLSFSSLLSSSYPQKLNELSHSSTTNFKQKEPSSSCYTNPHPPFKLPHEKSGSSSNMGLPLSTVFSHGYSLLNQCFGAANESIDYHSGSYNHGFDSSAAMSRSRHESIAPVQGSNTEVSSSQSAPGSTTSASSHAIGVYGLMGASSMVNGYYEVASLSPPLGNSGLLDAIVVEGKSLSSNDISKSEDSTATGKKLPCKRKSMAAEEYTVENDTLLVETAMKNSGNITNKKQKIDLSSSQFSTGKKLVSEDSLEGMNFMDDDLFSLLNNFPSEVPMPGWYSNGERQSMGLETQQQDASSSGPTDKEFAWTLGTFWSNMPNMLNIASSQNLH